MKKILLFIALISTLTTFSQNYNDSSKNSEISVLNESIIKNNKQIKKQRIYKWMSIIGNVGLACYIIKTK